MTRRALLVSMLAAPLAAAATWPRVFERGEAVPRWVLQASRGYLLWGRRCRVVRGDNGYVRVIPIDGSGGPLITVHDAGEGVILTGVPTWWDCPPYGFACIV